MGFWQCSKESCTLEFSSIWVPLFQASEKMELTTLWDRPWEEPESTPLSEWPEWFDCDSANTHKWCKWDHLGDVQDTVSKIWLNKWTVQVWWDGELTWYAGRAGAWSDAGRRERRPIIRCLCPLHGLLVVDIELLPVLHTESQGQNQWLILWNMFQQLSLALATLAMRIPFTHWCRVLTSSQHRYLMYWDFFWICGCCRKKETCILLPSAAK